MWVVGLRGLAGVLLVVACLLCFFVFAIGCDGGGDSWLVIFCVGVRWLVVVVSLYL